MVWLCPIGNRNDNQKDNKKDNEAMSLTVDNTPPTPEASEPFTPRAEYPRPILVRDQWQSLNGSWLFRVDPGNRGLTDAWFDGPLSLIHI